MAPLARDTIQFNLVLGVSITVGLIYILITLAYLRNRLPPLCDPHPAHHPRLHRLIAAMSNPTRRLLRLEPKDPEPQICPRWVRAWEVLMWTLIMPFWPLTTPYWVGKEAVVRWRERRAEDEEDRRWRREWNRRMETIEWRRVFGCGVKEDEEAGEDGVEAAPRPARTPEVAGETVGENRLIEQAPEQDDQGKGQEKSEIDEEKLVFMFMGPEGEVVTSTSKDDVGWKGAE